MKKSIYVLLSPFPHLHFFALLFLFLVISCENESVLESSNEPLSELKSFEKKKHPDKVKTFYGPAIPIGKGIAQAFVTQTFSGNSQSVGLRFSGKSLENLPTTETAWILSLPNQTKDMAINHITLGWNPNGHEPPGIYDVPHFDFHFYMVSENYVSNINDEVKAEILAPFQYWPETYFPTPGFVPMMGKHWLSGLANELQPGGVFTHTFIYGSYDGEFIFYEPMITLEYLNEKGKEQFPIFQPEFFQRTGLYYPTSYSINYDDTKKEFQVLLDNMVLVE